jgi:hypothetical protein
MNKRGLSHIEFVVSFAIFVGFLVFAFVFFNPLQSQRTLKSTMDYAWIEVSQEGKESMESYSVSIGTINGNDFEIVINGVPLEYNASVEDINGNILPTHRDSTGKVYFTRSSLNDEFFKIRYASSFDDGPIISGASLLANYVISSSETRDVYFESSFLRLNETYYSEYTSLKQDLNLPNRIEFGFIVTLDNYQIRAVKDIPEGIEVLSKNDRVEIIRTNGVREFAEVTVIVW